MFVIVFNHETMEEAKRVYRDWPFVAEKWHMTTSLSDVIDEAIDAARDFGDIYKPKIFIVKD